MADTHVGQSSKDDPADVAWTGLMAAMASVTPAGMLAEQDRTLAVLGY